MRHRRIAAALLTLTACSACAPTATITRYDGWQVEAEITRSTEDYVYIQTEYAPEQKIARADIAEIDHPGNVLGVVGLSIGVTYTITGAVFVPFLFSGNELDRFVGGLSLASAAGLAFMGFGFAAWGWNLWNTSVTNARPEEATPELGLSPIWLDDGAGTAGPGAGLRLRF